VSPAIRLLAGFLVAAMVAAGFYPQLLLGISSSAAALIIK
jgi:hypothetical protein